jgi:hypothetical protein
MFLWVPSHSEIQGNENSDDLARIRSSNLFLGPEPAIPVSPLVGGLKVKEWLTNKHYKNGLLHCM